ncbi:unnamed protein product [Mytilus coruscus]|uniref:Sushi domain-containing protein n=1 Tax=Mytilus coruscus TaxID=42192 RepID=A0A6J8E981_MYTCO|nr:unnamed protein product [Mytilus coruscus]
MVLWLCVILVLRTCDPANNLMEERRSRLNTGVKKMQGIINDLESLAGKCADHNCEEGQKCQLNAKGNDIICVEIYCKGLPITPHGELQEPFGLRRNLDTGNKYKCDNGYKMKGKPFAVCKSPGQWTVLFNCTSAKGVGSVWIGLKDKRWMTGESFKNIFGVTIQLNDYDGGYPSEVENSCGLLYSLSSMPLQDENCNIRKRPKFLYEIHMWQN